MTCRPRCQCCNKPLRYSTESHWFNRDADRPKPRTKEEALRRVKTNLQCVSVGWHTPTSPNDDEPPRYIMKLNLWDGETYDGYPFRGAGDERPLFCGVNCAARFGVASHRGGYRIKGKVPS